MVTLSDANARVLDRCVDRAVYRIFGVCDNDNVSSLRAVLGLQGVSNLVNTRTAEKKKSHTAEEGKFTLYLYIRLYTR